MHTFTIAFISTTLSLSVYAASIGDSISQLVTREQHNRHFHNPDFASGDLLAAESSERSGKISSRQPSALTLGEVLAISRPNLVNSVAVPVVNAQTSNALAAQVLANARTQAVTNAQAVTIAQTPQVVTNAQTVQAAQAVANAQTPQVVANAQTPQVVANAQTPQVVANAQAAQAAVNAQTPQAVTNAQTPQAVTNAQTPQVVTNAQTVQAAIDAKTQAAVNAQTAADAAVFPLNVPSLIDPLLNLGIESANRLSLSGQIGDTIRRQMPPPVPSPLPSVPNSLPSPLPSAPVPSSLQTTINQVANSTGGVATREESLKLSDDQVKDMDFSVHEADVSENFEEGF